MTVTISQIIGQARPSSRWTEALSAGGGVELRVSCTSSVRCLRDGFSPGSWSGRFGVSLI
jgi:hypothetical protein